MNPASNLWILLLMLAPLTGAVLSMAGKFILPRVAGTGAFLLWFGGTVLGLIGSADTVLTGGSLLYILGGWREPLGITLEIDGVTWLATFTDLIIGGAAWLMTRRYRSYTPLFYFFFFLALFSLQGILYTRDLFNLFVWLEVLSLSSFMLISYHRSRRTDLAAFRYIIISTVSIAFFLIGLWVLYRTGGNLSLPHLTSPDPDITRNFALLLLTVAILTKAAVIPFHTWLPEAHAAAPFPVSALLSGFVIKAPVLALWRIYEHLRPGSIGDILVWVGTLCALLGVIAAMVQRDAKKLLGYHSVSQMGYILAAFGVGSIGGQVAALFYIIGHALFKSLLFLTVGRVTEEKGSRDVYTLRGLGRSFPLEAFLFLIAAFSISGVPLFAGYSAKLLVSKSLGLHFGYYLLLAAAVGTAASFFKLGRIFFGPSSPSLPSNGPGEAENDDSTSGVAGKGAVFLSGLGMVILALGCLAMGVFPGFFQSLELNVLAATGKSPDWYTWKEVLKAFITLGGGFIISLFLLSPRGKQVSHSLRKASLGINGSLRLLIAGTLGFILLGVLIFP